MSVNMRKYGLQCLYDLNVSSGINVRFYAYCAHFPGIDIGRFRIETMKTDYQDIEIATQPTNNIKKIKFRGLYTWISTQVTNQIKISLLKKAVIIIDPDLWPGSYLPQIFYAASNKEFVVQKHDTHALLRDV